MEPQVPPNSPPIVNFAGPLVALGPLRHDLLPLSQRWINDWTVSRTLGPVRPLTAEHEEEWYAGASKDATNRVFTIYVRATLQPIGTTGLHEIDFANGTAEFGIVIGEQTAWGHGYGTEVARLMLDYGFMALGLHNIWLRVLSSNERGLRAYRRAGFREIGRRREAVRLGGQAVDVVFMDCLASEFSSPVLGEVLRGPSPLTLPSPPSDPIR